MKHNIIWKGIEYHSLEDCIVDIKGGTLNVVSTIAGSYSGITYLVRYNLQTNASGETMALSIHGALNDKIHKVELNKLSDGLWQVNNNIVDDFTGCMDVDIAITPFTNTLPIRRLNLQPGEEQEIRVIYFDVLEGAVKQLSQKYKCLTPTKYHYENVPNDFEANITVDEDGLVVHYPTLFTRQL